MKIIPKHNLSEGEKIHRQFAYKVKGKLIEIERLFKRINETQYSNITYKNYKVEINDRWIIIRLIKDPAIKSYYRAFQPRFLFDDLHKEGRIRQIKEDIASSLVEHLNFIEERNNNYENITKYNGMKFKCINTGDTIFQIYYQNNEWGFGVLYDNNSVLSKSLDEIKGMFDNGYWYKI